MAADIYLGATKLNKVALGATTLNAVYLGTNKIWPSVFNPLSLFAAGQVGAYYEIGIGLTSKGFHRCYQDVARTTPCTAAGQPIRSISDLSGYGKHVSSNNSTICTLQLDAKGYYMQGVGTSAYFYTATINDAVNLNLCIAACFGYGTTALSGASPVFHVGGVSGDYLRILNDHASLTNYTFHAIRGGLYMINTADTIGSGVDDRTYMMHTTYGAPNTNCALFKNGSTTNMAGGGAAGAMPNAIQIQIGRTSAKFRAGFYWANSFFAGANWVALSDYWKSADFNGSNPI
jgi:hypothetical protein